MNIRPENLELQDRLSLIETMIAEGRKTAERWGWSFVLWGVAYYAAIAWGAWGHSNLAWPVTMAAAALLTAVIAIRGKGRGAETTIGRAIGALWFSVGTALFIFCLCGSITRHIDLQVFISAVAVMLGTANAVSSMILRWKSQFAVALVWWTAGAVAPFANDGQCQAIFLIAIFLCQIVFGIYMMLAEARERREITGRSGTAHA